MSRKLESYRRLILIGMTFIAVGITFSIALKETASSVGIVLIAVGGLFFIVGMSRKRKEEEEGKK